MMSARYREPAVTNLVVGLGGVGVRVLRHLKQLAAGYPELDQDLLACFGIDTEPGMQHREADALPPLEDPELLVLDGLEVRRLCTRLAERGDGRTLWPEIEAWLPGSGSLRLVDDLAPTGEALLRPLGRLVYWRYEDIIRTHVSRALRRLPVERGPGRVEGVRRVVVVASTGGGTGSGLLGELVELVRGYEDVIELIVALVVPTMPLRSADEARADVRTPRRRRIDANTYACLKEIHHLRAGTLRWQGSTDGALRRQRRQRWCERVFLSDDAKGAEVAAMLAFGLLRAGHSRLSRIADRVTDADSGAEHSDRRWSAFSYAAGTRVDLAPFLDPRSAAAVEAPASLPPRVAPANPCAELEKSLDSLHGEVHKALQSLTADDRRILPARDGDRNPVGLVGDVLGRHAPVLQRGERWQGGGAWAVAGLEAARLVRQQRDVAERYVRDCAPGAASWLDGLRRVWDVVCEADETEERRGAIVRHILGVTRAAIRRRDEKLALALMRRALDAGGATGHALVARVAALLLAHKLGEAPAEEARPVPPTASVPGPPAAQPEEPESLAAAVERQVLACRARVFDVSGPRRERLAFCLAVVPRARADIEAILLDRVPEILGCDVEIERHDANVLWLYHEDPFHEPKDIVGVESWYRTFAAEPHPELCFVDRRFVDEQRDFTELVGDEGLRAVPCGNGGCRADIRREARSAGACPACGRWIRSRCGNETCTLENLHQHAQAKARSCPACGGLNRAAWWVCRRHGKVEQLVSVEKPRCPACVERHLDDPIGYPEPCIGLRPDFGRYRECPGCVARREKEPEHQPLLIGPDLMPFVCHGVNGHDRERFLALARRYRLDDEHLCPRCRCFLIPVHHAGVGWGAACDAGPDRVPRGFPIAAADPSARPPVDVPDVEGAPQGTVAPESPPASN